MGAFEEVLQTRGVLAVVGEYGLFARSADTWQRWVRRTRLAAKAGGTMGLLLGPPAPVSGFETGWHITTASADLFVEREALQTDWRSYWSVQLTYSRQGIPCADKLVYDGLTGRLQSAISWPDKDWSGQPAARFKAGSACVYFSVRHGCAYIMKAEQWMYLVMIGK